MPIGAQPHRARGTVGHPNSALNLRLALATFGLVTSIALAVILFSVDLPGWAVAACVLALTAAIDLVVIQLRRRARRRREPGPHSLFE